MTEKINNWQSVEKFLVSKGWWKDDLGEEIETWSFQDDDKAIQLIARPNDVPRFVSEFSIWVEEGITAELKRAVQF